MKGYYTLSSSVPSDGHFTLVVCDSEGQTVGEVHLKRPVPKTPSQYAGEMYMWDTEDVKAINEVKHHRPTVKIPEWMWSQDERRLVEVKIKLPKAQAPRTLILSEWRKYFNS